MAAHLPLRVLAALLAGLTAVGVAGCSGGQQSGASPSDDASKALSSQSPDVSADEATPESAIRDELRALLTRRAAAMKAGDRKAFLADIAPKAERRRAGAWFNALGQLPVRFVGFELGNRHTSGVPAGHYVADVEQSVQLGNGFDPTPLPIDHVFEFAQQDGVWRVVRDRADPETVTTEFWRLRDVDIRVQDSSITASSGLSSADSQALAESTTAALAIIDELVPYRWSRRPVVLAADTPRLLASEGLDPSELNQAGGLNFPIRGADESVVGFRAALGPLAFEGSRAGLTKIVTHELAHLAIGKHDAAAQPWLAEGIAEYVAQGGPSGLDSWQSAIDAARAGKLTHMPLHDDFYLGDWGESYGVAVAGVTWLGRTHGADAPFDLLNRLNRARGATSREQEAVLQKMYDVSFDELARHGQELILDAYGRS